MKSYNSIYYLLTVLLIMGGFASMAQNDYGMLILSGVSLAFGLIFLLQLTRSFSPGAASDSSLRMELFALFLLAALLMLKTFQVYIPFTEWIFAFAALVLAFIYFGRMIRYFRQYESKNKVLAILLAVFYLAIVFFFLSMVMISFNPGLVKITGGIACILIFGAVLFSLFNGNFLVTGEKTTAVKTISGFRDRYFLLISLFVSYSPFTLGLPVPACFLDYTPTNIPRLIISSSTRLSPPKKKLWMATPDMNPSVKIMNSSWRRI